LADDTLERFERAFLPLMDDAYTLARTLTRHDDAAQDAVQEAYLRAWRHFPSFRGDGGGERAWLLTIVRHCCYTWRERTRVARLAVEYKDEQHGRDESSRFTADARVLEDSDRRQLRAALAQLPAEHREVIVLREIEGMSYKEIASVVGVPIGTVMSRLARARERLQHALERSA